MAPPELVHLHVHSQYSMLDASIRVKPLVERVKAEGMSAVALTDHGNMFGALQLYKACKDAGVKSILGCEVGFVPGDRKDDKQRHARHLVLLAATAEGYKNLVRIVSRGWVDAPALATGPRIDFEILREHKKGLIGLSACMGGYVAQEILEKGPRAGRDALGALKDVFEPGRFFVELQDHGFPEQRPLNRILVGLARDLELGIVATNDCHYLEKKDARAQLVLQCIAGGRTIDEAERTHHGSSDLYLKSADEMAARFAELPEAIRATVDIAAMCELVSPLSKPKLPRFPVPEGLDEEKYFRKLAADGLEVRLDEARAVGRSVDEAAYRAQLAMECDVIASMGFPGYFLIGADFINWAKGQGIPVGPGRGSGAGSIVAWSLRITDLDPIPYGLLFERFLNPERVSMPDFDVDFCMDRRDEVIRYVQQKFGHDSVGQIATFHLLKSRSVVRDVGRVMRMTPQEAGQIATLVPEPVQGKSVAIAVAMEQEAKLKERYDQEPAVHELLDTAMKLEDLTRHAGMHAAGVVISEGPLWDHVPVFCPEPGVLVTQYHKDDVEAAGLVKFDFLGLKTLTVIDIAGKLVDRRPDRAGEPFRIDHIPLDDKATYALLQSGETTNVFQLESSGMQGLFRDLKPDCFEDIIAAVALYRPGPLGSGMVQDFVQRKHGRVKVAYPHKCLEATLKDTYGVIVYQEQVMQAAREMAGFTLGAADLLRRAMGKKKAEEMAKQKAAFVEGAVTKGYAAEDATKVFELIDFFAGYGFNKSHSAAYALITYQTAYLKAHFPVEFVCATLTADKDKIEKVVRTVAEARSMGLTVLPPDVNESEIDFTVVYEAQGEEPASGNGKPAKKRRADQPVAAGGKLRDPMKPMIRFGLGGVKGIGSSALEAIFEARRDEDGKKQPFTDLFDFAGRVDVRRVNKAVGEALVQCGAFDLAHKSAAVTRAQAFAAIDGALERGRKLSAERTSGQTSLLGLLGGSGPPGAGGATTQARIDWPKVETWDTRETLTREKGALGFYVSGHPLDRYATELKRFCNASTMDLASKSEGTRVTIGGAVEAFRERTTKMGHRIAFFELEDALGRVEVIVRPRVLDSVRETLLVGEPGMVTGVVQFEQSRGAPGAPQAPMGDDEAGGDAQPQAKLVLEEVAALAAAVRAKTRAVRVRLLVERIDRQKLVLLREALSHHPGPCPVTLELASPTEKWAVQLAQTGLSVEPSEALLSSLERLFGEKVLELR